MLINPSGKVFPCHAAEVLPGLSFENVREKTLEWIWQESSSFQRFRGEDWMADLAAVAIAAPKISAAAAARHFCWPGTPWLPIRPARSHPPMPLSNPR